MTASGIVAALLITSNPCASCKGCRDPPSISTEISAANPSGGELCMSAPSSINSDSAPKFFPRPDPVTMNPPTFRCFNNSAASFTVCCETRDPVNPHIMSDATSSLLTSMYTMRIKKSLIRTLMIRTLAIAILFAMCVLCESRKLLLLGSDVDIYGCKSSGGYSWCIPVEKCIHATVDCAPPVPQVYDLTQEL